jgi:ParB family chromosome partitioning protein
LLEPILIAPAQHQGKFEIILGQRRFLAHQQLGLKTIAAGILDKKIDALHAKVLSVTENLVRRDLNQKDLIDVCTYLYKKYGSMKAVQEVTGLPYNLVTQYVKYDRLIPELKKMVDGGLKVDVALRAQDASAATGNINAKDAVMLAKEMEPMSGAQRKKIHEEIEKNPEKPIDEAIEGAKEGGKITQILVTLGVEAHASLNRFASDEGITQDDAAANLIENGLKTKGYLEGGS